MSQIPSRVEKQFAELAPYAEVLGSFEITDELRDAGGGAWADWFDASGQSGVFILSPLVLVVRYFVKAVMKRDLLWGFPPRLFLILTPSGAAVGRSPKWSRRNKVKVWIIRPDEGRRYELDQAEVREANGIVEISIDDMSYWASGSNRDAAYRYFGRQRVEAPARGTVAEVLSAHIGSKD